MVRNEELVKKYIKNAKKVYVNVVLGYYEDGETEVNSWVQIPKTKALGLVDRFVRVTKSEVTKIDYTCRGDEFWLGQM